jgi:hypothetical protein
MSMSKVAAGFVVRRRVYAKLLVSEAQDSCDTIDVCLTSYQELAAPIASGTV